MAISLFILRIVITLIGYGLIIGGFLLFGDCLPKDVMYLDMVVSCLIFTQLPLLLFFPLINLKDKSHKEVGSLGIQLQGFTFYNIAAIAVMVAGALLEWSFKTQLYIHIILFFLQLVMILASLFASNKVKNRYHAEDKLIRNRAVFKSKMAELMDEVNIAANRVPVSISQPLQAINDSMTYLIPTSNPEATILEENFCSLVDEIQVLMRNIELNQSLIEENIKRLELILAKRKKY